MRSGKCPGCGWKIFHCFCLCLPSTDKSTARVGLTARGCHLPRRKAEIELATDHTLSPRVPAPLPSCRHPPDSLNQCCDSSVYPSKSQCHSSSLRSSWSKETSTSHCSSPDRPRQVGHTLHPSLPFMVHTSDSFKVDDKVISTTIALAFPWWHTLAARWSFTTMMVTLLSRAMAKAFSTSR